MGIHIKEEPNHTAEALIKKPASGALSSVEQLVSEIWLLDAQTSNGGLSQYFCNYGLSQWKKCMAAAATAARRVEQVITGPRDPYKAILKGGRAAENSYYDHRSQIIRDLRGFAGSQL